MAETSEDIAAPAMEETDENEMTVENTLNELTENEKPEDQHPDKESSTLPDSEQGVSKNESGDAEKPEDGASVVVDNTPLIDEETKHSSDRDIACELLASLRSATTQLVNVSENDQSPPATTSVDEDQSPVGDGEGNMELVETKKTDVTGAGGKTDVSPDQDRLEGQDAVISLLEAKILHFAIRSGALQLSTDTDNSSDTAKRPITDTGTTITDGNLEGSMPATDSANGDTAGSTDSTKPNAELPRITPEVTEVLTLLARVLTGNAAEQQGEAAIDNTSPPTVNDGSPVDKENADEVKQVDEQVSRAAADAPNAEQLAEVVTRARELGLIAAARAALEAFTGTVKGVDNVDSVDLKITAEVIGDESDAGNADVTDQHPIDVEVLEEPHDTESQNGGDDRVSDGEVVTKQGEADEVEPEQSDTALEEPAMDSREYQLRKRALYIALEQAQQARDSAIQENVQVENAVAEMLRRKRIPSGTAVDDEGADTGSKAAELEQRYRQLLESVRATTESIVHEEAHAAATIAELTRAKEDSTAHAEHAHATLMAFKRKIAATAVSGRTGKTLAKHEVDAMLDLEETKHREVRQEQLKYFVLRNQVAKLEADLSQKEQLGDGLHFIDFEQLKIENQSYNEKIEERNEELSKLKTKITNTIQVLTHMREKLAHTVHANEMHRQTLKDVEAAVAKERDLLSRQKRVRDKIRKENITLHQQCGLIDRPTLLADCETQRDIRDKCARDIHELNEKHATARARTLEYKKRLEQLRDEQPDLFLDMPSQ
eukprot:m.1639299 g.1639299  ORF g.1639299 m.1639299 type:complete len:775 (-) comp34434_c0_seq1:557-2881(-)